MKNYLYEAGTALAGKHSVRTTHRNYIEFFDHVNPVPSWDEIQAKIAELQAAEPLRLLRLERDARIAKTDWRATVDYPGTDQAAWLTYRQALRDLPATAEPELDENGMLTNVTWPEEPV